MSGGQAQMELVQKNLLAKDSARLKPVKTKAKSISYDRAIDKGKVRNHGTKFRIKASDLPRVYHHHKGFGDG